MPDEKAKCEVCGRAIVDGAHEDSDAAEYSFYDPLVTKNATICGACAKRANTVDMLKRLYRLDDEVKRLQQRIVLLNQKSGG